MKMKKLNLTAKNLVNSKFQLLSSVLVLIITLTVFFSNKLKAQGDLLITPQRVVFEGSKKIQELNLANLGKDTAKYTVSIIHYRMKPDGSFEEITTPDPGQYFADKFIRFFPRTVTLAPNEAQVVKMQLTNTDKLTSGEYRSHVYFRAVPNQLALGEVDNKIDTSSIAVKLIPIYGITIPVIIRVGELNVKADFSNFVVEINNGIPRFEATIHRTGNMSIYGDITINHVSATNKVTKMDVYKGVAVYTPNTERRFSMEIQKPESVDFKEGKIQIIYSSQSDVKPEKFAEAEFIFK